MIEFSLEIDAAGLMCPLPLLRLKKALISLENGHVVKIIATDPAAHLDFGVFVNQSGHVLLEVLKQDNKQIFYIKKQQS